ncbi:MAG TPA: hypothetical protein VFS52_20050 [Steroidobacteraceae bacterium]|nr:hypothetical protein [Steroidobacteraceae bacterium]
MVWSHNFESAAEVGAFRVVANVGNDPNNTSNSNCIWDPSDGFAGGGCLSISVPTGKLSSGYWNRPMSALKAGSNGKSVDDLAANGTLPRRTYNANSTSADWDFRTGYYGHPAIQQQFPTWNGQSNVWDGTEFYIQFRAKISGSRWTPGNPNGKLMFIDVTGLTGSQEIVIQSENTIGAAGDRYYKTAPFRMYTSQGSEPNSLLTSPQGSSGLVQPGGAFPNCTVPNLGVANACWEWPKDEWVTVLVHVIPGRDNSAYFGAHINEPVSSWPYHDTTIEAWVARAGATSYTKVYEQFNLAWDYYSQGNGANGRHPPAFNKIGPTAYMNSGATPQPAVAGWSHKFTQMIFSKQFIPCPA